ncbi:MAG: zeta toxin family protein [Actinomycetota bacterium]|nr:zeta toxin family protein [Actinomycetota bacterium]
MPRPVDLATDADPPDHKPRPLADTEWSERYTEVRAVTFDARRVGLETNQQNTIDDLNQIWTRERTAAHETIISDYLARSSDVPRDHNAVIAGGLGGAGKTTVLEEHAGIDLSQYLTINPDHIKVDLAERGLLPELDGVTPMEASDLAHEETSYIAKQLAGQAREQGINIIYDITMSSLESTEKKIDDLRLSGYEQIVGVFVDIPIETSVARAEARHRAGHELYRAGEGFGGRLVRPELIHDQADSEWGSQNRRTFERVKYQFDSWSLYDNSVEGRAPLLIERSSNPDFEHEETSA